MGYEPATDHLELWRGIDDAVWREALRQVPPAPARRPPHAADRWNDTRRQGERAPQPAAARVPEPV